MEYKPYNFVSVESIFAEVKEEMKSYFETGAVTEIMLPTYVDQCLRKFKVAALKPERAVLFFENFKSVLPDDFFLMSHAMKYESTSNHTSSFPLTTTAFWSKSIECIGNCSSSEIVDSCNPKYEIFEKITCPTTSGITFTLTNPHWVNVYYTSRSMCTEDCPNIGKAIRDTIGIHDTKRVTANFESGAVCIRYLTRPTDEEGLPLIPEIFEVEDYIKAYIKYKLFEQLWNSVVDETFRQIETKMQYYKQEYLQKYQAAWAQYRLTTKQQDADALIKQRTRLFKYHID